MGKTTRRVSSTQPSKSNEERIVKSKKEQICSIIKRKTKQKFLSESQKEYYEKLELNQITICSGPAGVGKSYIAMKGAVDLLSDPNTPYEKIIIVRPAVEAEEKLGSLPGNALLSTRVEDELVYVRVGIQLPHRAVLNPQIPSDELAALEGRPAKLGSHPG